MNSIHCGAGTLSQQDYKVFLQLSLLCGFGFISQILTFPTVKDNSSCSCNLEVSTENQFVDNDKSYKCSMLMQ